MCKAKHYSEQLLEIYNNVINDVTSLNHELSQADLYEQDVLHMIENGNFNAFEGYKFAKMIYDNRIKRRQIKNELEPLFWLKSGFIDKSTQLLNNTHQAVVRKDNTLTSLTENKVYIPRVIGKSEIINESIQTKQEENNCKLVHKKSGKEIEIIQKLDDNLYYVKFTNSKKKHVLNRKNIKNIDKLQIAK